MSLFPTTYTHNTAEMDEKPLLRSRHRDAEWRGRREVHRFADLITKGIDCLHSTDNVKRFLGTDGQPRRSAWVSKKDYVITTGQLPYYYCIISMPFSGERSYARATNSRSAWSYGGRRTLFAVEEETMARSRRNATAYRRFPGTHKRD